jgi:iron complex transport system ATP-binding protein
MSRNADRPGPVLELRNATVRKGETTALDSITLTIHEGEHTAIVGPNGAGKSTLVNLLTHEERPLADGGGSSAIRVFGDDRWNVFELRSRLGIVSGDLHHRFVNGNSAGRITAHDAVLSRFFAAHGFVVEGEVTPGMRDAAADALTRLGVGDLADTTLDRMSTGEARRVLIARALVTNPDALLLDEPTTGLDLVARHEFLEAVRDVARRGTTLVLVTHRVEEIIPEIQSVVLLRRGRVVAAGPKQTTLTDASLSATFDAPIALTESGGYYAGAVRTTR